MTRISIGDSLSEAFSLIRRRPLIVVAWGLAQTLFTSGVFASMAPLYGSLWARALHPTAAAFPATPFDPVLMMRYQGLSNLLSLAGWGMTAVLYCAVFRAVLRPEARRFAYLRLGAAEGLVFLMGIVTGIALAVGMFALLIPAAIIAGIGIATHAVAIGVVLGVVAGAAALVALSYLALRFCLLGPMIVDTGRLRPLECWALTRGATGSLFLIFLCVVAIFLAGEVVVAAISLALGLGVVGAEAGGLARLPAFFQRPPRDILASLSPMLAVLALVWIPAAGAGLALLGAPLARAYRDLSGPDLAATFS